jgi:hypothetical protein
VCSCSGSGLCRLDCLIWGVSTSGAMVEESSRGERRKVADCHFPMFRATTGSVPELGKPWCAAGSIHEAALLARFHHCICVHFIVVEAPRKNDQNARDLEDWCSTCVSPVVYRLRRFLPIPFQPLLMLQ